MSPSGVGVHLALDDFGTGYSAWSHLKRFPVGQLKLDRSFVASLPADLFDQAIVTATIAMAHRVGMAVTAEGVETQAQAEFLIAHGCDLVQGWLYAAAEPANSIARRLVVGRLAPQQPGPPRCEAGQPVATAG